MTPERLNELNRLHRNVDRLEHALRVHRAPGDLSGVYGEAPTKDARKRAAKIIEEDLERQLAEAKRLFAAAGETPTPAQAQAQGPEAEFIQRLRDVANLIETSGPRVYGFSESASIDGQASLKIEYWTGRR